MRDTSPSNHRFFNGETLQSFACRSRTVDVLWADEVCIVSAAHVGAGEQPSGVTVQALAGAAPA